jgi:hypothetical protein
LPGVCVEGAFRHVLADVDFGIHIPLSQHAAVALLYRRRHPGRVAMVDCVQALLNIRADSELGSRSEHDPDLVL